jgi:hypothetical protein
MRPYHFGDVLRYSDISRTVLMRWADIDLIKTAGGGSPGRRREFSFRNLVEVLVCHELHWFGLPESLLADVVRNLNRLWDGALEVLGGADGATVTEPQTYYLVLGHIRFSEPPDETVQHTLMMQFVDPTRLLALLDDGGDGSGFEQTAIVVPVSKIIDDLEAKTGDKLHGSWRDEFERVKRQAAEELAATIQRELKRDDESE